MSVVRSPTFGQQVCANFKRRMMTFWATPKEVMLIVLPVINLLV